jgi:hypothetical protein
MTQHFFSVNWSMGLDVFLCSSVNMVWIRREFGMMRDTVPTSQQLTRPILPVKAILSYLDSSCYNLETLEHLQQSAIS